LCREAFNTGNLRKKGFTDIRLLQSAGVFVIMRLRSFSIASSLACSLLPPCAAADSQLTSWYTVRSSTYARIYETDAELAAGTSKTTWTRTSGQQTLSQSLPVYAGPQQIDHSDSWVYIKTPNLATYVMGPWYDDAARSTLFINICTNQNLTYRIPRSSTVTIPSTKTATLGLTVGGTLQDGVGILVDGTMIFDPTDGYTYSSGSETMGGSGQWHRDAYVNEGQTFDKSLAHQQNTGKYHHHADPMGLRYQLGDHVAYNATTKTYSEMDTTAPAQHSPIIGWMLDGLPVYGPYGYSSALDATSGIRRMIGGFVKRNGTTTGVDNITTAGRTLPAWALRNNGNVSASGPTVSTSYPLGRYNEDWAYLGDLTKSGSTKYQQGVDFDLNEYNVRWCVTPEFPSGTWAYFLCIDASGTPQFPYMLNRWIYGNPTGGSISSVTETVTNDFKGGVNLTEAATVSVGASDVVLKWSSVEGGTYKVEASQDLGTWTTLSTTQTATENSTDTAYTEASAAASHSKRFYRVARTTTASYDDGSSSSSSSSTEGLSLVSPSSGTRSSSVTVQITLNSSYTPAPPPVTVAPTAVTLTRTSATTIAATSYSRNSTTGVVTAVFTIPSSATVGTYTVNATFGPNTWSMANGFTVK
jgi:YHYH protein